MTIMLGELDMGEGGLIAVIALFLGAGLAWSIRPSVDLGPVMAELGELRRRVDALLKHQGAEIPMEPPSGLTAEVERLAADPNTRIAAIKLYREQNPGSGLAEAKLKVEEMAMRRR